jgi:type VI secretion system protein ImpK
MRLTDCFAELIAYVAYFLKTVNTRQPDFDQVKADIQRLIAESQEALNEGSFSREDYDQARFAVFAWIDEAILSSSWDQKHRWQGEQLQRFYYQTTDAGEIFFDRLNAIGTHQRDVREVYYLCLAMGFMGRFCHEGDEYLLEQVKTSNLKLLTGSTMGVPSLEKDDLFPSAYPSESADLSSAEGKGRFSTFTLLCMGIPVVFYLFLFMIYLFILGNIGENLLHTVPQ